MLEPPLPSLARKSSCLLRSHALFGSGFGSGDDRWVNTLLQYQERWKQLSEPRRRGCLATWRSTGADKGGQSVALIYINRHIYIYIYTFAHILVDLHLYRTHFHICNSNFMFPLSLSLSFGMYHIYIYIHILYTLIESCLVCFIQDILTPPFGLVLSKLTYSAGSNCPIHQPGAAALLALLSEFVHAGHFGQCDLDHIPYRCLVTIRSKLDLETSWEIHVEKVDKTQFKGFPKEWPASALVRIGVWNIRWTAIPQSFGLWTWPSPTLGHWTIERVSTRRDGPPKTLEVTRGWNRSFPWAAWASQVFFFVETALRLMVHRLFFFVNDNAGWKLGFWRCQWRLARV